VSESKIHESSGATTFGYLVEARSVAHLKGSALPIVGGRSVGADWVWIAPARSVVGVPSGMWDRIANAVTDLLSYEAASALMAWLAAEREPLHGFGLEFRLVKCKLTYEWRVERESEGAPVSFRDRENLEFPVSLAPQRRDPDVSASPIQETPRAES
jgi:hypothetical protein